jgi:hypothetical protein
MRDFRDAKAMARTLREALAARGFKMTVGESLETISRLFGAADWNTLSAAITAAPKASGGQPAATAPPEATAASPSGRTGFSVSLERTLHRAVALANQQGRRYTTLEHLLLALVDDSDASEVLTACAVDLDDLRTVLNRHLDDVKDQIPAAEGGEPAAPTAGFERVIQRAVIHVWGSGRGAVTGANILTAVFSEPESQACATLRQRGMTRYDAVNFIANGIRKSGGDAVPPMP